MLKNVRLSFSQNLTSPKAIKGGKPRYTANFIIDPKVNAKELAEINATIKEIADEEFNKQVPEGKDCCLRNGDKTQDAKTGEAYKGYEGKLYLSAARAESQGPPLVVNRAAVAVQPRDDGYPQPGDYVNAKVNLFSINGKNDKGGDKTHGKKICCSIEAVQFKTTGESLGGSRKPTAEGFEAEDEESIS